MADFEDYKIQHIGLKKGKHQYNYKINNTFFELFDFNDFHNANVDVALALTKKENLIELDFDLKGTVGLTCDVSTEPYQQEVDNHIHVVIKFGEDYQEVDEELVIVPLSDDDIAVGQFIYEGIILALPAKRIHPKVEDGSMETEITKKLEELKPSNNSKTAEGETDPRWDKLKELLNDK
jgi:uncharacterized metal-binding protein YceD (DUF177 family)